MKLYQARLLSWTEYIDKIIFADNFEWVTILKEALDIFNGKLKGLANLPDT